MPLARRHYILIAVLALGLIAMTWFIAWDNNIPLGQMTGYGLFGLLMVALAVLSLRKGSPVGLGPQSVSRWGKRLLGAYALAFAIWMLGSVVLLPFVGYAGFDLIEKPWFGLAFLLFALLLVPITWRYMR